MEKQRKKRDKKAYIHPIRLIKIDKAKNKKNKKKKPLFPVVCPKTAIRDAVLIFSLSIEKQQCAIFLSIEELHTKQHHIWGDQLFLVFIS